MVKIGIVTGNATAASLALVSDAERLGVDSVWIPEAWMFDGLTPAAFVPGRTETMRIGTACVQLGSRSPALLAMSALSLQAMSGARRQIFVVFAGFMMVERFGFAVHDMALLFLANGVMSMLLAPRT